MALQKGTVSINLGNGIDQKTDDKIGPDDSFSYSRDLVFKKVGKIYKRFGTNKLDTVSNYPISNPLSIGSTFIPNNVIGFKDQLLLQNKGVLYSQYGSDDTWYFKGHHYPVTIDKNIIHSNHFSSYNADSQTLNGITAYVYYEANANDPISNFIKLTVIEEETGNYILNNYSLEVQGADIPDRVKIAKFSTGMYAVWRSSNTLKIANIPSNSTTAIVTSNLVTDMAPIPFGGTSTITADYGFDIINVNKAGVGERNFVAYYSNGSLVKVFSILPNGALDITMGFGNVATVDFFRGPSIHYNPTADDLFVGFTTQSSNIATTKVTRLGFTSSSISVGLTNSVGTASIYPAANIAFAIDPVDPSHNQVFWDEYNSGVFGGSTVSTPTIYRREFNATTVFGSDKTLVINGLLIAGKPVNDSVRKTIYVPTLSNSVTQATHFILDIFRGRSDTQCNVLAKFNYGLASTNLKSYLPSFSFLEDGKYYLPTTINVAIADSFGGTTYRTGISRAILDLEPTYAASNVTINNAVYMSGGYVGYYDDADYYEHGFFLNPEPVQVSTIANGAKLITFVVNSQGTVSTPEITTFTFTSAGMMASTGTGVGPSNYFTFVTPANTFNVGYRINGNGTIPVAAGINVLVTLDGNETPEQVAFKTASAIINTTVLVTIISLGGGSMTIRNALNGVVADATVTGMVNNNIGTKNTGATQYSVIWYYIDNNGQVMRSAPSVGTSVTYAANSYGVITAWAPPITNKNIVQVQAQLYLTTSNGSLFHKASALLSGDKPWNQSAQQITFTDTDTDNSIAARELLYTTGGVLPNFSIGATKHLSLFKNRIIATDEDSNSFFYSKTALQGLPIEFSEELSVDMSDDTDPLMGHCQLDDKLTVYKAEKSYYLAGDGANDTGTQDSFTVPTLIASDVGTTNHNSLIQFPFGVMLKSNKGIYILDRSLQLAYIGKEVEDFNANLVSKAVLLKEQNQIRFELQDSTEALVYDYYFRKWQVFSQYDGTDATMWAGKYARVDYDGSVFVEIENTFSDVGSDVEIYNPTLITKWLQIKNVQDFQRVYRLAVLGDLKSPHNLRWRLYYDYDETNYDEYIFSSSNITGNERDDSVYQPEVHLRRQKGDAIKIEMTILVDENDPQSQQCLQLVDISFVVGAKAGLQKVKAGKKL